MPLERVGQVSTPYTRMKPHVIGGICEFCGVVDNTQPSEVQYQLCPHFKDIGLLQCSYCPQNADPIDVIKKANIKVHEHPDKPGVWVAVCDSYNCTAAHEKRFVRNV
jgi:hypothetical protein